MHQQLNTADEGEPMENEASSLEERVGELRKELYQIKEARDGSNLEARKWAEKRNRVHKNLKDSTSKIAELKERHRAVNNRLKVLRANLQNAKGRYRKKGAQTQNLNRKLKEFVVEGSYMNRRELEDRIEGIEWRIQTTPLSLEEERILIEQVKILESQLVLHEEMRKMKDERKSLRDEMKSTYEEISELFEQRGRLRKALIEYSKTASELKAEADKMHGKYLTHRDESQKLHLKYVEILNQVRSLEQQLAQIEEEEKTKRTRDLERDLEKKALEKLKNRKKLTLEEFKILAEKGKI